MNGKKQAVSEIKRLLQAGQVTQAQIHEWKSDTRLEVCRLMRRWDKSQAEIARVSKLYEYEYEFERKGCQWVAGVDEAGRGPLAGPVVVAAVILPLGLHIPKINDSKKLSAALREEIYEIIQKKAIAIERAVVSETEIDRMNIYRATIDGMYTAIRALKTSPDAVLIDAVPLDALKVPSLSLIKGDSLSASIAAASIVAKVERDRMMNALDKVYPAYGFARHKGYGTAEHIAAIEKFGPCKIHRRSFAPVNSWRM